jgi:shikimate dehydrogenase
VLGAGGTAQAAVAALAELGLRRCTVLVRDASRSAEVRATASTVGVDVEVGRLVPGTAALRADLVISTLPAGAADVVAASGWASGQVVLDVVYSPWPTRLAQAAAACGATVIGGAAVLLHQAAAQVALMTGRTAPVDAMRVALAAVLPGARTAD